MPALPDMYWLPWGEKMYAPSIVGTSLTNWVISGCFLPFNLWLNWRSGVHLGKKKKRFVTSYELVRQDCTPGGHSFHATCDMQWREYITLRSAVSCIICPCVCEPERGARCRARQINIVYGSRNPERVGREHRVWKWWCKRLKSALKSGSFRDHNNERFHGFSATVTLSISP